MMAELYALERVRRHEHWVQLLDVRIFQRSVWLIFDRHGTDLNQLMYSRAASASGAVGAWTMCTCPEVRAIVRQAATALRFLHDLGMMHSDVTPSNILVSPVDNISHIRVADLGHVTQALLGGARSARPAGEGLAGGWSSRT